MDDAVDHRSVGSGEEAEILDESDQQKIIDDIEQDYHRMVRTQAVLVSLAASCAAFGCALAALQTKAYFYMVFPILAFGTIVFSVRHRNRYWPLSIAFEITSLVMMFRADNPISNIAWIFIHGVYILLAIFWWSSHRFLLTFPEQIRHLGTLKYGVKLA
jgi:hypothetical protein